MAVSLYFGLPGCGKTTLMTQLAYKATRSDRYSNVYCNVPLSIPGVTYIDNECIGTYELRDCLLLIDEATLFADSRDFKNFSKGRLEYFLEHRHRNADICLFTQQWDGVDRKIRVITDRVYYVYKGFWTKKRWSKYYRIPYGIVIPDPKKGGDKLGEIVQGYSKPPWYIRLFSHWIYRPKWYPYFDSWELDPLPDLPVKYAAERIDYSNRPIFWAWLHKTFILLRLVRKKRKKQKKQKMLAAALDLGSEEYTEDRIRWKNPPPLLLDQEKNKPAV